ncbi:19236_t:CDS:2 [Cetraspora pellucida]|uniref:19236_t:CDS:1 n=1 Tax=Cetraspora pellucida TaxID=1433469 RepID=A0A9N9CWF0_9GLOM|nr:19236_t:CDS:2 [Cetraspora pellucida]
MSSSKINKPKNNKKNTVKQKVTDASKATTSAVPVAPFTDFTNLNMLFQPHYPTSLFFMNLLVLNKATAKHQETKLETTSELTFNDNSVSDTSSTSEALNNQSKSK